MLSDVTINLTGAQPSGSASFGIPLFIALIPAPTVQEGQDPVAATPIPYTECTKLEDVVSAGFTANSKLYKAVQLMKSQTNKPKTFAIYGSTAASAAAAASEVINENWRQLITVDMGTSTLAQVAAVIEAAEGKFYIPSFSIANAATMTDEQFKTARDAALADLGKYDRTFPIYYDDSVDTPEAAVVGETAARAVGSFTYKNIILKGIEPLKVTESRLAIIEGTGDAPKAATIVRKAGDIVLSDGRSASGEYVDVVDSYDWIKQNLEYNLQKVFNSNPKVPYTNAGIVQLEDATRSTLKRAFDNGMIAETDDNPEVGDYSTDFARASEVDAGDRANRHYKDGNFTFRLAGAIHTAEINGTVTV